MKRNITKAAAVIAATLLIAYVAGWRIKIEPTASVNDEELQITASIHATLIDLYFASRGMPLAGYGKEMVEAAETNGIDWRLLPAIAVRESSGGLQACGANVFGWASCKRTFKTIEEGIQTVARHLGGNATSTATYYRGKITRQILEAYNPPSIVPDYARQVEAIMDAIAPR